jgi:hypothetical protein
MLDRDERAEVIHKVFTGVNTENYDLVAATLKAYERQASNAGHLKGFLVGLVIGAIIGVMVAGLSDCGEPPHSKSEMSSAANASSSASRGF